MNTLPLIAATLTEFRSQTSPSNKTSYITPDGGIWDYDASKSAIDNGGTIVKGFVRRIKGQSINVQWFGTVADGVTDDRPAIEKAVNYCVSLLAAQSVELYFPEGAYFMNTPANPVPSPDVYFSDAKCGVGLPVNTNYTFKLTGAGKGVTVFKLSNNCRNVFFIDKKANYDVFRNYVFQNFTVDNNNAIGRCHILIGNVCDRNATQKYLSYDNIVVQNGETINIPVYDAANVYKWTVALHGEHLTADESTRTYSTNIKVLNWTQTEGSGMALVCCRGVATISMNHYHNNITFDGLSHTIANPPAVTLPQSSFFICANGFGDNGTIRNCYSKNIGDDAIEVGAMSNTLIENIVIINPFLNGILFRNVKTFADVNTHKTVIRNVKCIVDSSLTSISGAIARPIKWLFSTTIQYGNYTVEDFQFIADGFKYSNLSGARALFVGTDDAKVKSIDFLRTKIKITNYNFDDAANQDVNIINIAPPAVGTVVSLKDTEIAFQGTQTSTGAAIIHGIRANAQRPVVNISNYNIDFTGTTLVFSNGLTIAKNTGGGQVSVNVINMVVIGQPTSGTMTGIAIYSDTSLKYLNVLQSDFSLMTSGFDIDTQFAGNNLKAFFPRDNNYRSGSDYGSFAAGDIQYRNSTGKSSRLPVGAVGTVLTIGNDNMPAYKTQDLFKNNQQLSNPGTVTTEVTLFSGTIPANTLGPNGVLTCELNASYTNSANSKSFRMRIAGTLCALRIVTTTASARWYWEVINRNSQTTQLIPPTNTINSYGFGESAGIFATPTINFAVDNIFTLTAQVAVAAEVASIETFIVTAKY